LICAQADATDSAYKEKIMKHLIAVLSIVCLLVSASVLPAAAAQDAPAAPVPCNPDQVKQVTDIALHWGDQMNTVWQATYDKTLDGDTASLLDWGDLYVSYFKDIYDNLPACIDGAVYGDAVGLFLNRQMTISAILVLNDEQNAAKSGDADVNQALSDTFKLQANLNQRSIAEINGLVNQLKAGTGISAWAATCDAEQAKFSDQLDGFDQTYYNLRDGLQAYLDSGTVEKDTYIASLKLVGDLDTALAAQTLCADFYVHLINELYTYGDTLTTLTLGQIAPYMSGNASADRFNTLLAYCNDALYGSANGLTAATATEEP
jgi:hypothetical protein